MRPKFFAPCAASLLLASIAHCALAQNGDRSAPLISSGHPSAASPAGSSGARRQLSDDPPASALRDNSASLRDESWTLTPEQHANSATQSSRSAKPASESGATSAAAFGQRRVDSDRAPLQALPEHAAPLQRIPSQDRVAQAGPSPSDLPSEMPTNMPSSMPAAAVQTAGAAYPSSGASHLRSPIAQAQFTSAATSASEPSHTAQSVSGTSDVHRPLKPPTADDSAADEKRSTGTVQMFVSVISSLLIVVGILLGAAWCYRKATPNLSGSLPKQVLQVLGRTPLAPRQQLILVRFGPKLVLMSNLQGEVRTISEIVDPLEVDRLCGMCESSQAGSISDSFRTVLHNIGRTG